MPRFCNKVFKKRKNVGKPKIVINLPPGNSVEEVSVSCSNLQLTRLTREKLNSSFEKFETNDSSGNEIFDLELLSNVLMCYSLCLNCRKNGLQINSTNFRIGLASQMRFFF